MILVDTSMWVEHLRWGRAALRRELEAGRVLAHPFVIGELACGTGRQMMAAPDPAASSIRRRIVSTLAALSSEAGPIWPAAPPRACETSGGPPWAIGP